MPTLEKKKQTNDKKSQAYSFFISKGYTPEQSAGIVGNLIKESSLNTKAEGDIGYAGGSSFGIAQWRGDRLTKLKNMYGNNWSDFNNQLEYIHWELNNTETKAGQALKNAKDVHSAGAVMSDLYERPKVKYNQDKTRQRFVTDVYKSLVNSDYEYVAPQSQEQTDFDPTHYDNTIKSLNYLPETNVNTTFAGVPNINLPQEKTEEKEETDKDIAELQTKTAEQNFLEELHQNREIVEQPQPQQQKAQAQPVDYMQMYEQVSNFVDTPLIGQMMQQGGVKTNKMNEVVFNMMQRGASTEQIINQLIRMSVPRNIAMQVVQKAFRKPIEFNQQGGKYSENELAFLSEIAIKDQQGQRRFPNQVTEIQGDTMATNGYGNIPLYVIPDKGKPKVIQANTGEHKFKGATKFIEIPLFKK